MVTRHGRAVSTLAALIALVAGCGLRSNAPAAEEPAVTTSAVWPGPPATARIRFVRTIGRPGDLGVRPSAWQRLGELVAGRHEEFFVRPTGIVVGAGKIYVADPGAQALWILDTARGRFRKIQKAGEDTLVSPVAVAVGTDGRVYVADSFLRRVFVYDASLDVAGVIATPDFRRPAGLALDTRLARLYVADSGAHRVFVHDLDGTVVSAFGERGPGAGAFNFPTFLTVDPAGRIHVIDSLGFRIQMFTPEGAFLSAFGRHGDSSGDFASPKGVALDSEGHVYVVEALFDAVQIFDAEGRFLLAFGERGLGPGQFWLPAGIFIDADDRIYVADTYNQRIQIFQYLRGAHDG
jgi:DNA-binding beta-propeller fold protein YncE